MLKFKRKFRRQRVKILVAAGMAVVSGTEYLEAEEMEDCNTTRERQGLGIEMYENVYLPTHCVLRYSFRLFFYLNDIVINCNWVVTRWQQYSTHLHTN